MTALQIDSRPAFELTGGSVCLDFINTLSRRQTTRPVEHLFRYSDMLRWGRLAGVLSSGDRARLTRDATEHPVRASRAFVRALAFREVLYEIFVAVASRRVPSTDDLSALSGVLRGAFRASVIRPTPSGFEYLMDRQRAGLDSVLWAVARSALDLLVSPSARPRVRECAAPSCSWLFLDTTRNRSRRWCAMKVCGNRNKVRRYRERTGNS